MMHADNKQRQAGFTIVELLVAMTVFSLVLVAAAASIIQIGRMYYKGVITARTQDTSRAIIDEISRSIQFSGEEPTFATTTDPSGDEIHAICFGSTRYTYKIDAQVGTDPYGLFKDVGGATCETSDMSGEGTELLGENMRLSAFEVEHTADQYKVTVWVVYGDDDVIEPHPSEDRTVCRGAVTGSQFCAVSELSTVVARRLL